MPSSKLWALTPVLFLCLAACGSPADKTGDGPSETTKTLATVIGDETDFGALEAAIKNAGLADVLEGKGPYTVFAPADAALTAAGSEFGDETMKAQSAELLRAHIVPGVLTRADIVSAIQSAGGRGAQMRTMADGLLTFSQDGDAVVVTAEDGAVARLTGEETIASNGVVQPVDGVLVKAE